MTRPDRAAVHRMPVTTVLLCCTLLAALAAGPVQGLALAAPIIKPAPSAVVLDPAPAPGSVLAPGTHLIAASVVGIGSSRLQFSVDGQPIDGPTSDVDGRLGNRRGVLAQLGPGRHTITVEAEGDGQLRSWDVVVAGVEVQAAGEDPGLVGIRMAGSRAGSRPVVLVDPEASAMGAVGVALAGHLDGVLLPTGRDGIPARSAQAIRDVRATEVIILGGVDVVTEAVAEQLLAADLSVVRLDGATAAQVAVRAADWVQQLPLARRPATGPGVVIAPVTPDRSALAGAIRAVELGLPLLLLGDAQVTVEAARLLTQAEYVLLSDALPATAVEAIDAVVPDRVVRNLDPFTPAAASELVVVTDDAAAGAAAMAAQAVTGQRAVVFGEAAARAHVAAERPTRVTIVGPDATADALAGLLRRAWVGTDLAPVAQSVIDERTRRPSITFTTDRPLVDADVHVELLGLEWPGQTIVAADRVVWTANPRRRLPEPLEPQRDATPATIDITATFTSAEGVTGHLQAQGRVTIDPVASLSREGFIVHGGSSDVVGTGPLRTFSVAVEPATGLSLADVTDEVEQILLDPRGWTADGSVSLQRIGAPNSARIEVVVATPSTVDAYCGAAGLRTGGRVSCWDGYRALLNLDRWNFGVPPFHADLTVYRQYLVNHEVGHGLSHGHVLCPAPGALAPVMVQQTGGLGGCRANGWPFPDAIETPPAQAAPFAGATG